MKWTKEGIEFNITSPDCDDAISFEKMLGHDREEQRKLVESLYKSTKYFLIDSDGKMTEINWQQ